MDPTTWVAIAVVFGFALLAVLYTMGRVLREMNREAIQKGFFLMDTDFSTDLDSDSEDFEEDYMSDELLLEENEIDHFNNQEKLDLGVSDSPALFSFRVSLMVAFTAAILLVFPSVNSSEVYPHSGCVEACKSGNMVLCNSTESSYNNCGPCLSDTDPKCNFKEDENFMKLEDTSVFDEMCQNKLFMKLAECASFKRKNHINTRVSGEDNEKDSLVANLRKLTLQGNNFWTEGNMETEYPMQEVNIDEEINEMKIKNISFFDIEPMNSSVFGHPIGNKTINGMNTFGLEVNFLSNKTVFILVVIAFLLALMIVVECFY